MADLTPQEATAAVNVAQDAWLKELETYYEGKAWLKADPQEAQEALGTYYASGEAFDKARKVLEEVLCQAKLK